MNPENKTKMIAIICSFTLLTSLVACNNNKFKIKGEIYGGEDKPLVLEKSDFQGRWFPVDSTYTNHNGGFSFSFPAPMSSEIYRLEMNGQYVYIPVDSTETITLNSSFADFGRNFSLSGSKKAEMMEKFEKDLHHVNITDSDSLLIFKRNVYSNYMKDFPGSILSFYILTKTIDGKPLYNPTDRIDSKYFAAVATGYQAVKPEDPHTKLLQETAIRAMQEKNKETGKFTTIEAAEISLIDMNLQDENGDYIKLSDVAGNGKPVVVIFSLLNHQDSPEFNMALAKLYNKHNGNVIFYNVSLDADQYAWREAAKNLPWITVYSPGQESSPEAIRYNVFQIPSFYIYNSQGELSSRPMTLDELEKSL